MFSTVNSDAVGMLILLGVLVLLFCLCMWGLASQANKGTSRRQANQESQRLYNESKRLRERHCATLFEYDQLLEEIKQLKRQSPSNGSWTDMIDHSIRHVENNRRWAEVFDKAPYATPKMMADSQAHLGLADGFNEHVLEAAIARLRKKYDPATLAARQAPPEVLQTAKARLKEAEKAYTILKNTFPN